MTVEYVAVLIAAYPAIREVWLIGSRADNTASPSSDWDYLAFADRFTFDDLARRDGDLNDPAIDLLLVYDDDQFCKPWPDGERQKKGSLSGWEWRKQSDTHATYRATKPRGGDDFNVQVTTGTATRVYPA